MFDAAAACARRHTTAACVVSGLAGSAAGAIALTAASCASQGSDEAVAAAGRAALDAAIYQARRPDQRRGERSEPASGQGVAHEINRLSSRFMGQIKGAESCAR